MNDNYNYYYLRHYDPIKGRDNDKPDRYTVTVSHSKNTIYESHYSMLYWIYRNIPKCLDHCRWDLEDSSSTFKFRFQKHAIMFSLRWL